MKLNKSLEILVLHGGDSSEREVSFRSAASVLQALEHVGYENVRVYDPAEGLEKLIGAAKSADVVLPIIHGENCEDGVIQAALERSNIPFLGAGSVASKNALSKELTHKILDENAVLTPKFEIVTRHTYKDSPLSHMPHVVKTIDGGSSVDCMIVREVTQVTTESALNLLQNYEAMILEEFIEGLEITVGVLGEDALPVILIIPPKDGEFDYENKYNGKTQEICPVPDEIMSQDKQLEAQKLALRVHSTLGSRHLSRVDMMVSPDGKLYVLELNTIPGMTDQSLFPKAAAAAGVSMPELVRKFVDMALKG